MKGFRILFALLAFFLSGTNTTTFASAGWTSASTQVSTTWDQVQEVNQHGSVSWGSQIIESNAPARCVKICYRECETIMEIVYDEFTGRTRTIPRTLCRYICETSCYEVNP
jgi:hypothetical protein